VDRIGRVLSSRPPAAAPRRLLLFTKPAYPGRVKTRLIGDLTAAEAAELHAAFLADLVERLRGGSFEMMVAWALEAGEEIPREVPGGSVLPGVRQVGADLGERLHGALWDASRNGAAVAAVGSDHPDLAVELVEEAYEKVEAGTDVVLGPAEDGGYYLVALRPAAVAARLFAEIPWSTERALEATLARCRELGLTVELLPQAADVDTPEDLRRLASRLAEAPGACPRTRALLATWGRLPEPLARAGGAG
jgi:uncharacterized protein